MNQEPIPANKELKSSIVKIISVSEDNEKLLSNLRISIDGAKRKKVEKEALQFSLGGNFRAAFLAFLDSEPVGYVQVAVEEELPEKALSINSIKDYGHLMRIGVSSKVRRMGVAKSLTLKAESWLKKEGKSGIWLDYLKDNQPAGKLYSSLGYTPRQEFVDNSGNNRIIAVKKFLT